MNRPAVLLLLLILLCCAHPAHGQAQYPPPNPPVQLPQAPAQAPPRSQVPPRPASTDAMEPDQRAVQPPAVSQQVLAARLDAARHVLSLILSPSDLSAFLRAETKTFGPSDSQDKLDHRVRAMDQAVKSLVHNVSH